MNNYVFLAVGVLVVYLAITGRLIRVIDVLRTAPGTKQPGGGGKSGMG